MLDVVIISAPCPHHPPRRGLAVPKSRRNCRTLERLSTWSTAARVGGCRGPPESTESTAAPALQEVHCFSYGLAHCAAHAALQQGSNKQVKHCAMQLRNTMHHMQQVMLRATRTVRTYVLSSNTSFHRVIISGCSFGRLRPLVLNI